MNMNEHFQLKLAIENGKDFNYLVTNNNCAEILPLFDLKEVIKNGHKKYRSTSLSLSQVADHIIFQNPTAHILAHCVEQNENLENVIIVNELTKELLGSYIHIYGFYSLFKFFTNLNVKLESIFDYLNNDEDLLSLVKENSAWLANDSQCMKFYNNFLANV